MKTFVFTPPDETGILVAHIIPYAGSHDTRLGCESSWPQGHAGPIFFRPLLVKGASCALTGRGAFLFRGNVVFSGTRFSNFASKGKFATEPSMLAACEIATSPDSHQLFEQGFGLL